MFDLPRQLTWPAGFAIFLLVMTVLFMGLRRRSTLYDAIYRQVALCTVVMVLITGLIYLTLPSWDKLIQHH